MFMQTRLDASLWLPRPDENPLDYWVSLSPLAPLFGISWRFAEWDYPSELETPEPEAGRIDTDAEDAEIVPQAEAAPAPAPAIDDLTEIKGIGPKMAQRLAEQGITSFAQIAEWSSEKAAEMNDKLGCLPGMIERAEWVRQARDMTDYAQARQA